MKCINCGKDNPIENKFCSECGAPLPENTTGFNDCAQPAAESSPKRNGKKIALRAVLISLLAIVVIFLCWYLFHPHQYSVWTTVKEATCTSDGYRTRTCSLCRKTETETLSATGHSWKAATCTEPKTCIRCGLKEGSALGHSKNDSYNCSRCGLGMATKSDVPNILDITRQTWEINSVGGIEPTITFKNKSSTKTIKYIDLTVEFFNSVGDKLTNDIGFGQTTASMQYTGPLKPGASETVYWNPVFYNSTFGHTLNFKKIEIQYTDGTTTTLEDGVANETVVSWR